MSMGARDEYNEYNKVSHCFHRPQSVRGPKTRPNNEWEWASLGSE